MITSMENYTFNVREDEGIYIYFTTSSTTMHIRQGDSSIIWVTPAGWGWLASWRLASSSFEYTKPAYLNNKKS